jgi:hypothetical protein
VALIDRLKNIAPQMSASPCSCYRHEYRTIEESAKLGLVLRLVKSEGRSG